ncbi:MAG: Glu/Leu/Phe/Val dehydrogenase [Chloroflexi bacterium]|nr:Glu/Leu/Phe/Val dehydrogenase [Chloroflexota bacterium]
MCRRSPETIPATDTPALRHNRVCPTWGRRRQHLFSGRYIPLSSVEAPQSDASKSPWAPDIVHGEGVLIVQDSVLTCGDELGPARIIHVYEPSLGLRGILVVDNVAIGPAIGGLRMAPDVSLGECLRLARGMTLKNAAAGLPHGGGKSVLVGDPKMDPARKEKLIRGMAYALRHEQGYIFGPDMGTDETCMAWVKDEIGRSVGLPRELGGIPLDEIGATGWGMRFATEAALHACGMSLSGARVAIQGFGAVGQHTARFLGEQGAVLVAANDTTGTVYDREGLDVEALIQFKRSGRSLNEYSRGRHLDRDAIVDIDCDVWAPAARPDVLHAGNADRLKTRVVVQGANIPCTDEAEEILHRRGILVVPDFIASAGGVICAALEYRCATQREAFAVIEEKLRTNTEQVLDAAKRMGSLPRQAALHLAAERVKRAMATRRWGIV